MQYIVYLLEALKVFYNAARWRSKGISFYQDHLLFARLYSPINTEEEVSVGVYSQLAEIAETYTRNLCLIKQTLK